MTIDGIILGLLLLVLLAVLVMRTRPRPAPPEPPAQPEEPPPTVKPGVFTVGTCRRCRKSILWVPRPSGGWYPPMERLDEALTPEAFVLAHGQSVHLVLDGELTQVRLSALLVKHDCDAPEPQAVDPVALMSAEEHERLAREKREADEIRDQIKARRRQEEEERRAAAERAAERELEQARARQFQTAVRTHGDFIKVPCPACGVGPGEPCQSLSRLTSRGERVQRVNANPHAERMDYGWGTGIVAEDPTVHAVLSHANHTPFMKLTHRRRTADDLTEWLRENASILWSENWPTEDVNLFGNPAEALTEGLDRELT